ncbi:MAG TPA: hypothetical protein VG937_35470 [Polyangiaceae bacterium]|nr:hypothetical protein [Polyangiaceae bacterium]
MKLLPSWALALLWTISACGGRTEASVFAAGGRADDGGAGMVNNSGGSGGAAVAGQPSGGATAGQPSGGATAGQPSGGAAGSVVSEGGSAGAPPEPGWRQSVEPFCGKPDMFGPGTLDVWSDQGGVFLLVDEEIYGNTGSGWSLLAQAAHAGRGGLTGFPGGPLVRFGGVTDRCGIEFVQRDGAPSCSGAAQPWGVSVVKRDLAYAVYSDRLLSYDGSMWTQRGDPLVAPVGLSVGQIWANETTIAITNDAGVYVSEGGVAPALQGDLPEVESGYRGVWGSAAGEIWVGSGDGQLFRASRGQWTSAFQVPGAPDCRAIERVWGDGADIFFATTNRVFRGRNNSFETVFELACDYSARIGGLWGNSASEVFIAVAYHDSLAKCGNVAMLWFDGKQLRPL